jgi:hypothetical protein
MGLQGDEIDDIFEFLGETGGRSEAEHLLDAPFAAKPQLMARASTPTRFSDGSRRVFYSALEVETAENEVVHWYAGAALGEGRRVAYYNRLRCRFRGGAFDLRPMLGQWMFLIADGDEAYARCQVLANEAVDRGAHGLLTPSARRRGGTNVPVFRRSALADPSIMGVVALSRDPRTGQVRLRHR